MKQTPQAFSFWGAIIENSALHCHHSIHPFLQVFKFFFKKKKVSLCSACIQITQPFIHNLPSPSPTTEMESSTKPHVPLF